MRALTCITVIALLLPAAIAPAQDIHVPVGGGPAGIDQLTLVPLGGIEAEMTRVDNADEGKPVVKVTFTKSNEYRRLLALEGKPANSPAGSKALEMRYRLQLEEGEVRLAAAVFDTSGGAWYKTGNVESAGEGFAGARLPVTGLRKAAFTRSEGDLDWDAIERVWVGIVIDGEAEGTFELSDAHFTSERYRPTRPLRATGEGAGTWSVGKDPAVTATLTTPDEGPDGQPCMKVEFNFVGGRHMYMIPQTTVPAAELDGYSGLQLTYKATLPDGIEGLLVMLVESGGQFMATPMPKPSEEWTTLTIPFEDFALGGWSKDDNGQLDLDRITGLCIGTHGVAKNKGGDGVIMACDVQFVP